MDQKENLEGHSKQCGRWFGIECTCSVRFRDHYMSEGFELPAGGEEDFLGDEYEPPIRKSKSAKAKMGVSGRSIFTIIERIRNRGRKQR